MAQLDGVQGFDWMMHKGLTGWCIIYLLSGIRMLLPPAQPALLAALPHHLGPPQRRPQGHPATITQYIYWKQKKCINHLQRSTTEQTGQRR